MIRVIKENGGEGSQLSEKAKRLLAAHDREVENRETLQAKPVAA